MFEIHYDHPDGGRFKFSEEELQSLIDGIDALGINLRDADVSFSKALISAKITEHERLKNLRRIIYFNLHQKDD